MTPLQAQVASLRKRHSRGASLHLRALLDAVAAVPPAEGVDALAQELSVRIDASEVSMLIADNSGLTLARLARRTAPGKSRPLRAAGEQVLIAESAAGTALVTQQPQVSSDCDGVWVHVPVSERGEALGVLELALADVPSTEILDYLSLAGQVLAFVVIADRRFSDLYEIGQRRTRLTLEAEIQRRLLPASYACEGPQFALAGWLVPANEAGGDTFDYMVDRDRLHLSITDAMGHGVPAAQLATLAVGSLRNSRRRGLGLREQAQVASAHIAQHAASDQFVTALLGSIDLRTGLLEMVNAGHMNPLLVRDGGVRELPLAPGLVLGVFPDVRYEAQRVRLQPGDRLAFVTDGMSERDAAAAEIETLLGTLSHLHPRQTVQVLTGAVLHVTGGAVRDDATVLIVDWYGDQIDQ
ncbi:PP2C family protein-serine/threonine phosphatase [Angustibacter sp. Root456]|uniref:PP2C family protein-serine/threonine phosphatase n=1 Tax=Angustibacter sp. Root456 TaxID=1736539 RepID=UPI0019109EEE|nr:PP2C family protein-serine/threonine phosphatase [Angustibacter sp. Root456]